MKENKKSLAGSTIILIRIMLIFAGIGILYISSGETYKEVYSHEDLASIAKGLKTGTTGLGNAVFILTKILTHICETFSMPFKWAYNNALVGTSLMGGLTFVYGLYFFSLLKYRENEDPSSLSPIEQWGPFFVMSFFVIECISCFFNLSYPLFKDIYLLGNSVGSIFKALGAIITVSIKIILFFLDIIANNDVAIGITLILIGLLPTIIAKFKK